MSKQPQVPATINPELVYTQGLARVLQHVVDQTEESQEKVETYHSLAFARAMQRGREAVLSMLSTATKELADKPLVTEEDLFSRARPKPLPTLRDAAKKNKGRTLHSKGGGSKPALGDTGPSAAASPARTVMDQWRVPRSKSSWPTNVGYNT
jgi:hypothetical protein